MAVLCYLLLCHTDPVTVAAQARALSGAGDHVVIHADKGAGPAFVAQLRAELTGVARVHFAPSRRCGWGDWSLVAATLAMIGTGLAACPDATHFYLLSGDCMPIKSAHYIREALQKDGRDRIEAANFFTDGWIKTGLVRERLIYRHFFNERKHPWWFYRSLELQRWLGLERALPKDVTMRIGSQWWALRRETLEKILAFMRARPEIERFFRHSWIPDETFFQTLVRHLVPKLEICAAPPTFLMFSDYGMPVVFHADHFALLTAQKELFARKISRNAMQLRDRLAGHFLSGGAAGEEGSNGQAIYDYVRQRGRAGARTPPRPWNAQGQIGRGVTLYVICAKKWHIGQRIAEALSAQGVPSVGYLFDADRTDLPDLGGIEQSRSKLVRHRRAALRLIHTVTGAERFGICLDPSNLAAIKDIAADGCQMRLLSVRDQIDPEWLAGHAQRLGLSEGYPGLMSTLRAQIAVEQEAVEALDLPHMLCLPEKGAPAEMARPLAQLFGLGIDRAAAVARAGWGA